MGNKIESMKLFKLSGKVADGMFYHSHNVTEFITATTSANALNKFTSLYKHVTEVKVNVLCLRDDIIPTVDPKIEFQSKK